jgi:hypothetical protein
MEGRKEDEKWKWKIGRKLNGEEKKMRNSARRKNRTR